MGSWEAEHKLNFCTRHSILEVNNLSIAYSSRNYQKPIIENLSFDVKTGGFVFIVGRSGIGKSITIRAILGLLNPREWILQGDICINTGNSMEYILKDGCFDQNVLSKIRGTILSAIFQEPVSHLHPSLSIGYQFREIAGKTPGLIKDQTNKIWSLLNEVNIDYNKAMKGYAHEFSQGECQRILLSMALRNGNLLVADEPTSSINPTLRCSIIELLLKLRRKQILKSMVIVTHQKDVVETLIQPDDLLIGLYQTDSGIAIQKKIWEKQTLMESPIIHPCLDFEEIQYLKSEDIDKDPFETINNHRNTIKTPLLKVSDLCQTFKRGLFSSPSVVLKNVNFELFKGEMLGIIGPSGSGKSTFAKAVIRLLDHTEGRILFNDNGCLTDLVALQPNGSLQDVQEMRKFRKRIQYISQEAAMAFNPSVRIKDILNETIAMLAPMDPKDKTMLLSKSLLEIGLIKDQTRLTYFLLKYPRELSGGEKQRLNLLRCFLLKPKLIIADEPFANQDMQTASEIVAIMKKFQLENDTAFLLISHDTEIIRSICEKTYILQDQTLSLVKTQLTRKGVANDITIEQ